ncbi:MAG: hypothetical protein LBI85_03995 [Spirochaetaceae bacterium]|jgi:hypothetical protein|nr:hypothetical protein [Spirochaetaceae bacterium]
MRNKAARWLKRYHPALLSVVCIILCIFIAVYLAGVRRMQERIFDRIGESEENTAKLVQERTDELQNLLKEHDERSMLILSLLEEQMSDDESFRDRYAADSAYVRRNITALINGLSIQQRLTEEIEATYSTLLEEQKKRTVDESELDSDIENKREEAYGAFNAGSYKEAYDLFSQVLAYQQDNWDARFHRIYALHLLNPQDTSTFRPILEEIDLLKRNGYLNGKMDVMAEYIRVELEALLR